MNYIEILGIFATLLLIISMAYHCKDKKSMIIMRVINAVAAALFVVYSVLMNTYSTILSNLVILIIDIYYIVKMGKNKDDINILNKEKR